MAQTPIRDAKTHLKLADTCYNAKSLAEERRVSQLQIQGTYYDTYDKESALRISDLENGFSSAKFANNLIGDNTGSLTESERANILNCGNPAAGNSPASDYGFWYQDYTVNPGATPLDTVIDDENPGNAVVGSTCHARFYPNNIIFTDNYGKPTGGFISRDGNFIAIDPSNSRRWISKDTHVPGVNSTADYASNAIPLLDDKGKLPLKFMPQDALVYSGLAVITTDDTGASARWVKNPSSEITADTNPGAFWVVQLEEELLDEKSATVTIDGTVINVRNSDWIVYKGKQGNTNIWDIIHNDELKGLTNASTSTYTVDETDHKNTSLCAAYTKSGLVDSTDLLHLLHMAGDTIATGQAQTGNIYGKSNVPVNDTNSSCTTYVTNVRQNDGIVSFDTQNAFCTWSGLLKNGADVVSSTNSASNKLASAQAVVGYICQNCCIIKTLDVTETTNPLTVNLYSPGKGTTIAKTVELNSCTLSLTTSTTGNGIVTTFDAKANVSLNVAPLSHADSTGQYGLASTSCYGHVKSASNIACVTSTTGGSAGSATCIFARADHYHPATCLVCLHSGSSCSLLYMDSSNRLVGLSQGTANQVLVSQGSGKIPTWTSGSGSGIDADKVDGYHISISGNTLTFSE